MVVTADIPGVEHGIGIARLFGFELTKCFELVARFADDRAVEIAEELLDSRGRTGHSVGEHVRSPVLVAHQMREAIANAERGLEDRDVLIGGAIGIDHVECLTSTRIGRIDGDARGRLVDVDGVRAVGILLEAGDHVVRYTGDLRLCEDDGSIGVLDVVAELDTELGELVRKLDELRAILGIQARAGALEAGKRQRRQLLIIDVLGGPTSGSGGDGLLQRGIRRDIVGPRRFVVLTVVRRIAEFFIGGNIRKEVLRDERVVEIRICIFERLYDGRERPRGSRVDDCFNAGVGLRDRGLAGRGDLRRGEVPVNAVGAGGVSRLCGDRDDGGRRYQVTIEHTELLSNPSDLPMDSRAYLVASKMACLRLLRFARPYGGYAMMSEPSTGAGLHAAQPREPRQARKGATVSESLRVPWTTWPSSWSLFVASRRHMQIPYFAVAALAGALIALVIYHFAAVKPALVALRGTVSTHDELLGTAAAPGTARLTALEEGLSSLQAEHERVAKRVGELDVLAHTDISRIGFVRYDAFDDTGSELSYALALLNREGTGVVLSSIYSRTDTRTYGKAVEIYRPVVNASDEELKAIAAARA